MSVRGVIAGIVCAFALPGLAFAQPASAEVLGSGLRAPDRALLLGAAALPSEGSWIGLRSKGWGTFAFGRFDYHYYRSPLASGWSAASLTRPSAFAASVVSYAPPASSWQLGWTSWRSKAEEFALPEQSGERLWAYYGWGGLKLGLAWDHARLMSGTTVTSDRAALSVPLRYTSGSHSFHVEYSWARDDKATAAADSVRMRSFGYTYDLSKQTSLGLTYARVTGDGGIGLGIPYSVAGEEPRIWSFGLRHAF